MSQDKIKELELKKRMLELEEEEALAISQEPAIENDNLTNSEEILAYPAAIAKGATLGLDKYVGGAAEAAKRVLSGEDVGSPVSDYEAMRNRLISKGGVGPATAEMTASMYSPVGVSGKLAKTINPLAQSMIYGANGGAEGAAYGAGVATAIPAIGKTAKYGGKLLSQLSEIMGGDTKGVASAIRSKTPLTTTEERQAAQMAANKQSEQTASDVMDKVSQKRFEQGQLIDQAFSHLDKKVGKTIPATEITGYLREADKVANDWKGIPFVASESKSIYGKKPGYTGIIGDDQGKDLNSVIDEVSGKKYFMPDNITKKAKFAEKLISVTDGLNFSTPENKLNYQSRVVDLANKTDDDIQKEIVRAMDGRVSEKTSKQSIDGIENKFYNEIDSLNKKHIQNLTPSELRGFRDEIYDVVNYGASTIKGKMGGQRISLDVSPKGSEGKMFEGELKQIGRKAKDTLEKYADYHGVPLKDINAQYKALSDIEEFLPDAINIKNISDPAVLSRASMDKDAAIAKLRESGENDIANYLDQNLSDIFRKQSDIAVTSKTGGEATPFIRIPEQVIARAGNLVQRKAVSPIQESLKQVESIMPKGSAIPYLGTVGRKPQSVEDVVNLKIPRNTEEAIQSPELLMEKVKLLSPQLLPVVKHAIEQEPQKLPDVMFMLSQQAPHVFDDDKYGRFDGKIPASSMMKYISDVRDDRTMNNTDKAKLLNQVMVKKIGNYTPEV